MIPQTHIFGVRHLSPGAAYHLQRYLAEKKPKCILIEGPSDAADLFGELANKKVKPPVALLAYSTELPIETVLYPFASYSPEYQAILWAKNNKKTLRFIDLPCDVLLKLKQKTLLSAEQQQEQADFYRFHHDIYQQVADKYHESNYESYWERHFEHNQNDDTFRAGLAYQSQQIRELVIGQEYQYSPYDFAYNQVREAYMRRQIAQAIADGFKPEEIVVIVGAYHVSGVQSDLPPMTDLELNNLPRVNMRMTLMPYSYHRLSSRTGYGAGNSAPYYFELMWHCLQNGHIEQLPALYLANIAAELRIKGDNASSASVIEAVRLANALTSLNQGHLPVLQDLHDAVITCFGGGELSPVAEAINRVDIGTAIGSLPSGVSQTPVQEDVNHALKQLKLEQYKSTVEQELLLDLRENLRVKTTAAAFIDLNRSTFLHRLAILNIHFAQKCTVNQQTATWSEKWRLCWSPETEIEIVEANLKGETLEIAAAFELHERLTHCQDLQQVAAIVRQACECNLIAIFDNAVDTLQALLVDSDNFTEVVYATQELALLIKYSGIRRFNLEPLIPIMQQMFLRASLILLDASTCDDKAATEIAKAISVMDLISQEQFDYVDHEIWQQELAKLAWRDDLNAKLSGTAFSLLLEHNLADEDDCAKEVSRRLSVGVPASLGASWFEGLSSRNRYALLSRVTLWQQLDNYIHTLDEDEFYRSVVFLRRAFSDFEPQQKNSIAELLGSVWGTGSEATAEMLQAELTEQETQHLDQLNDFDFDF